MRRHFDIFTPTTLYVLGYVVGAHDHIPTRQLASFVTQVWVAMFVGLWVIRWLAGRLCGSAR